MAEMTDGHQTLISFASDPTVLFTERTVTPPGISGGGPIDTTNMGNSTWRTNMPKSLITLSEASVTVTYDPACYPEIVALVNVNNAITNTFPAGDTLVFWGWLDEFTPGEHAEGEQPEADITIQPSNLDGSLAEIAPAYTAPV